MAPTFVLSLHREQEESTRGLPEIHTKKKYNYFK